MWILQPGDIFDNRYRIERELGSGGMSYVYAAYDQELKEPVALKIIKPELVADEELVERFKREVRIARQIQHPNVIRIFEFGRVLVRDKPLYYLTMELLQGQDLATERAWRQTSSLERAIGITVQLCDALGEAHRRGVIHRDVKPANIFIDLEGRAKLMDFGISRLRSLVGMTRANQLIGTPMYMSPEQVSGGGELDHRSDIYSVGVILYQLAALRCPFEGESPVTVAFQHVREVPTPPRQFNPQIPAGLETIILRCLEKEPDRRYQSAEELRSALQEMLKGWQDRTEAIDGSAIARLVESRTTEATPTVADSRSRPTPELATKMGTPQLSLEGVDPPTVRDKAPPKKGRTAPGPAASKGARPRRLSSTNLWALVVTVSLLVVVAGYLVVRQSGRREAGPVATAPSTSIPASTSVESRPTSSVSPEPRPPVVGTLAISSDPTDALVEIDGHEVGRTPWREKLPPGSYRVVLSKVDFDRLDTTFSVLAGETAGGTLRLKPSTGTVIVSSNSDARIFIDEQFAGAIPPPVQKKLLRGDHKVRYELAGENPVEKTVRVVPGQTHPLSYRFALFGSLRVVCLPPARVRLDGKEEGYTPYTVDKIGEGEHELVLEREGYKTERMTITIRPREQNIISCTLTPLSR